MRGFVYVYVIPLFFVGCREQSPAAVDPLRQLPCVAYVERHGPANATHRIIHLLDWHYVNEEDYVADVGSADDFDQFLDEVEEVQRQQLVILRSLGVKQVYIEGLTDEDQFVFDAKIRAVRKLGQELAELQSADVGTKSFAAGLEALKRQHRRDRLQIGAAGQLLLSGEIEAVLPLEDSTP